MPRLNPDSLTFGTFTLSNPAVEQVIRTFGLTVRPGEVKDRAECGERRLEGPDQPADRDRGGAGRLDERDDADPRQRRAGVFLSNARDRR